MKIDTSIKKMEEALEKKKALRAEKSVGRIATLKERVKTKTTKIQKLTSEVAAMNAECADLISDNNVVGTETEVEPYVPGNADESKGSEIKPLSTKKTPPAKKK